MSGLDHLNTGLESTSVQQRLNLDLAVCFTSQIGRCIADLALDNELAVHWASLSKRSVVDLERDLDLVVVRGYLSDGSFFDNMTVLVGDKDVTERYTAPVECERKTA